MRLLTPNKTSIHAYLFQGFTAYAGVGSKFTKYSGSKSKYQQGEYSTSVAEVNPSRILRIGEDPAVKTECEKNVADARVRPKERERELEIRMRTAIAMFMCERLFE
jgi:hypothetical protein